MDIRKSGSRQQHLFRQLCLCICLGLWANVRQTRCGAQHIGRTNVEYITCRSALLFACLSHLALFGPEPFRTFLVIGRCFEFKWISHTVSEPPRSSGRDVISASNEIEVGCRCSMMRFRSVVMPTKPTWCFPSLSSKNLPYAQHDSTNTPNVKVCAVCRGCLQCGTDWMRATGAYILGGRPHTAVNGTAVTIRLCWRQRHKDAENQQHRSPTIAAFSCEASSNDGTPTRISKRGQKKWQTVQWNSFSICSWPYDSSVRVGETRLFVSFSRWCYSTDFICACILFTQTNKYTHTDAPCAWSIYAMCVRIAVGRIRSLRGWGLIEGYMRTHAHEHSHAVEQILQPHQTTTTHTHTRTQTVSVTLYLWQYVGPVSAFVVASMCPSMSAFVRCACEVRMYVCAENASDTSTETLFTCSTYACRIRMCEYLCVRLCVCRVYIMCDV